MTLHDFTSDAAATSALGDTVHISTPTVDQVWAALFRRLSPAGRNHALSHEAFDLFSALRRAELGRATVHVAALSDMTADRGFTETHQAAEALSRALTTSGRCDASAVQGACSDAIQAMILDGIINYTSVLETPWVSMTSDYSMS